MSSHVATPFTNVKIGGIGMGGGNHVTHSIENVIVGIDGDIIEELVDGQRGGFSGGCLIDTNRADSDQEFVIHSSSVKEKGTDDTLDAFDTSIIKRRTGV